MLPIPLLVIPFHSLQVADDFSNYQLSKLMKRSRISKKLADVRQVLKSNETAVIGLGEESKVTEVESSRIVSSDSAHYILVKGRELESSSQDDSLSQSSMEFPVIEELEPDTEEKEERGREGTGSEEHGSEIGTRGREAGVQVSQTARELLGSEAVVSKRVFPPGVSDRETATSSGISPLESGASRLQLEPTVSIAEVGAADQGELSYASCIQIVGEGVPERTAMTGVSKDRECVGGEEGRSERVGGKENGKAPQPVATIAGDVVVSMGAPPSLQISVTELSEDREGEGGEEEGRSGGKESRAAPQPVTGDVIELYIEEESVCHLEEKDSVNTDTHDGYSAMSPAPGRGGTLNTDGASDLVEYTLTVVDKESKVVEVADSGEGEGEGVSKINQSEFRMQGDRVGIISDSESGQSVDHVVESEYVDHTIVLVSQYTAIFIMAAYLRLYLHGVSHGKTHPWGIVTKPPSLAHKDSCRCIANLVLLHAPKYGDRT